MITIKDFMECVQYKITSGDEYCWQCYGPNARSMDYWNGSHDDGVTVCMVYDTETQVVYQMEAWDYSKGREYRWTHPDYVEAIEAEAKRRCVDHSESIDGSKFINLEVPEDILDKASAMVNGEEYDTRVIVPLELEDSELFLLMTYAHEADMSLNQFVEHILVEYIERHSQQEVWPPLDDATWPPRG
jgi:hypothetical protein